MNHNNEYVLHSQWAKNRTVPLIAIYTYHCVCVCSHYFNNSFVWIIIFDHILCVNHMYRFIQWRPWWHFLPTFWWQKRERLCMPWEKIGFQVTPLCTLTFVWIIKWREKFYRCIRRKKCGYRFSCPLNFHVKYWCL